MVLLYIRAVLNLIGGSVYVLFWGPGISLLASVAMAAGAFGIANDKKWGYWVAVGVTAMAAFGFIANPRWLISIPAMFVAAQLALLLHPLSRNHQRIWFT